MSVWHRSFSHILATKYLVLLGCVSLAIILPTVELKEYICSSPREIR